MTKHQIVTWGIGALIHAAAAAAGAWIYFAVAMAGFNTSQQTIAGQMLGLSSALAKEVEIRDQQNSNAQRNLADEIQKLSTTIASMQEKLSISLSENSQQIAALNGTLSGIDRRLTESIVRQDAFQATVLQRIVFQGPLPTNDYSGLVEAWAKAGIDPSTIKSITVKGDEGLSQALKVMMQQK